MFQDAEYTRFLRMQALHKVVNMPEYVWEMRYDRVLYARSRYYKDLNKPPVLNMLGLRILQGCEYDAVTQGAEYAWTSLNIPQKCINTHEYVLITLNIIEYVGIYPIKRVLNIPEFWILNVSYAVHGIRSPYKSLCSYRDRDAFRTLSNIQDGVFCENKSR